MVAKFFILPENYDKQDKLNKKHPRWLILLSGIILFIIAGFLTNFILQKLSATKSDAANSDLRLKNYEYLHKIYQDSLTKNFTGNSDKTGNGISSVTIDSFRVVCYYIASYNLSRSRQLPPTSVDPYLCTHIIVGFACITNGTVQPQSPVDKQVYKSIVNLKSINPSLKVLISVQDFSSIGEFAQVVSSEVFRTAFVKNTLTFLNSSGFDGIDLDWEFPSWPDADLIQVRNFTLLLGEFRRIINNTSFKPFILSVAVAAPVLIMRQSYEIQEMAKFIDFVNLMSYDYHMYSQYLPLTGPNAPLYHRNVDSGYMLTLNTNWSATSWVMMGMPLSKINIGIPTYGHSFRLVNENNNGWNAPASGYGKTGKGDGFFSYPEACEFIRVSSSTHVFDDEYDVPYAYNGNEWISYDNSISVEIKASYVKNNKFGGAMIYSLNCDDFDGFCASTKFPLTRTISNILTG